LWAAGSTSEASSSGLFAANSCQRAASFACVTHPDLFDLQNLQPQRAYQ